MGVRSQADTAAILHSTEAPCLSDVVVATIHCRLGTLGFLALNDGKTNGNLGLADQTAALDWLWRNIQDFGGDSDQVTIFGQSAGAGSVRALLASPKARGKFAGANMQINLCGLACGTTYSQYYTIAQEMAGAGNAMLMETNCTNAASRVDCLRSIPASTIATLDPTARYLVVDGVYLTASELELTPQATTPSVPLMIGEMRDDGAAFIVYPSPGEPLRQFLHDSGLPPSVSPNQLFPLPSSPNKTLDIFNTTARVATDGIFRSVDQATAYSVFNNHIFPKVFYYEFNRSYQLANWSPNPPLCHSQSPQTFPTATQTAKTSSVTPESCTMYSAISGVRVFHSETSSICH